MSGWFDSHCHVQEEYLGREDGDGETDLSRGPRARPGRPASTASSASAPTRRRRPRRSPWPGTCTTVAPRRCAWASVGLHPHEATAGVDGVAALLAQEMRSR